MIVIIVLLFILLPVDSGGLHGLMPTSTPPKHVKKYWHSHPGVISGYLVSGSPEQSWVLPHGVVTFSALNKHTSNPLQVNVLDFIMQP